MPVRGVAGNVVARKNLKHRTGPTKKSKKRKCRSRVQVIKRAVRVLSHPPEADRRRRWHLYVLLLEGGNYYIGITGYKSINHRYRQHRAGKGASWTRLHKPVKVVETWVLGEMAESRAVKTETETTVAYIKRYGIDRVRGGILVNTNATRHRAKYKKYLQNKKIGA